MSIERIALKTNIQHNSFPVPCISVYLFICYSFDKSIRDNSTSTYSVSEKVDNEEVDNKIRLSQ